MKKLLTFLGSICLIASSASSAVSCNAKDNEAVANFDRIDFNVDPIELSADNDSIIYDNTKHEVTLSSDIYRSSYSSMYSKLMLSLATKNLNIESKKPGSVVALMANGDLGVSSLSDFKVLMTKGIEEKNKEGADKKDGAKDVIGDIFLINKFDNNPTTIKVNNDMSFKIDLNLFSFIMSYQENPDGVNVKGSYSLTFGTTKDIEFNAILD